MIKLDLESWKDLAEHILDDSAGEIDDWGFECELVDQHMQLTFARPADETWFRVRLLQDAV